MQRYKTMKTTLNPHMKDDATRNTQIAEGGFGRHYTDHMITCEWSEKDGWAEPELVPYGPISLDPATAVFHYAQEIFEGMKAYRQPDGGVSLFRPEANAKRFAKSAARLALPQMSVEAFIETLEVLIKQDSKWVPNNVGESLYMRPFMFATEVGLGVRPSNKALYMLIATPASAYFSTNTAVSVWISTEYVRAALGGTGEAKCGGNYAASLVAQKAAAAEGCDQVVWIDKQRALPGRHRENIRIPRPSINPNASSRCGDAIIVSRHPLVPFGCSLMSSAGQKRTMTLLLGI